MNSKEHYANRINSLSNDLKVLTRRKGNLAWLRFASITGIILSWFLLNSFGLFNAIASCIVFLILFLRFLLADLKNKSAIERNSLLTKINHNEIKALAHDFQHLSEGREFELKEHYYANDIDLFGPASLYQLANRTCSDMGSSTLAGWLLNPADTKMIHDRQDAVKELTPLIDWRQELQTTGTSIKIKSATADRLKNWFEQEDHFLHKKIWGWARLLVPALLVTVIILNIAGLVSSYVLNYSLLLSALLAYYISKQVTPLHQQVSKMAEELEVMSDSIRLIENKNFNAYYLQKIQSGFAQPDGKASTKLRRLKKILERLDMRYNIVVFILLDILLQWDLQQAIALEKWKKENHENVLGWFAALGKIEALNSFANLAFNHPEWCYPVFKETHFFIEGTAVGHPLIPAEKCVLNDIRIEHKGELLLVTGSNMAGKSTYLRSIGTNTVLAMAGAPVFAGYFCLSPVQLITSMRITDNLEENTSTFYAELKKLKTIIEKVNNKQPVFILLDEILRGTNSLDRHTGSAALIRQLIKQQASCVIATHDIELTNLQEEFPEHIRNYHFDVQVSDGELYFDYKLKDGICTSLNASILMKKIGIEL